MRKRQNSMKGEIIRPCHVCGAPVNYVRWDVETERRGRTIYHWADPDGSHHLHRDPPASAPPPSKLVRW